MQTLSATTSLSEHEPAESVRLSNRMFAEVAERILDDEKVRAGYNLASTVVAFYQDVKDTEEWSAVYNHWLSTKLAYAHSLLKVELRALPELTLEHLPIILDPNRNPAFNSYGLNAKVREFYEKHPDAERPKNVMGGTFLFAANPDCEHINNPRNSSGVKCARCPGWFCF